MADAIPLPEFQHLFAGLYGVQLAGVFVSCAFYGASGLQTFLYYMSEPKDPLWLKLLPAWLILAETCHQALACVAIYKIVINNFGNEGVILILTPELFIATLFQGFVTFSAHLFYIYRIWKFGKKSILIPLICIPLTTVQLGMTLGNNSAVLRHSSPAFLTSIIWTTYVTHAINVFLDFSFVVAMIWLLNLEKRSPFRKTNRLINRLIVLTINTGLATATATFLTIVLLAASPNTLIYAFFNYLISPLYCNSVLANLNSRQFLRAAEPQGSTLEFSRTPIGGSHELTGLKFNSNTRIMRASETQLDEPGYDTTTSGSATTKTAMVSMI